MDEEEKKEKEAPEQEEGGEADIDSFVSELKGKGMSEEEIGGTAILMFEDGKLDRDEMEAILHAAGYELPEELSKLGDEELKQALGEDEEGEEDGGKELAPAPSIENPEDRAKPNEAEQRKRAFDLAGIRK